MPFPLLTQCLSIRGCVASLPHLCHVRQVRDEGEAVHLSAADVGLQKNIDLAVAVLHTACGWKLTVVAQQLVQLLQLLITDLPEKKALVN